METSGKQPGCKPFVARTAGRRGGGCPRLLPARRFGSTQELAGKRADGRKISQRRSLLKRGSSGWGQEARQVGGAGRRGRLDFWQSAADVPMPRVGTPRDRLQSEPAGPDYLSQEDGRRAKPLRGRTRPLPWGQRVRRSCVAFGESEEGLLHRAAGTGRRLRGWFSCPCGGATGVYPELSAGSGIQRCGMRRGLHAGLPAEFTFGGGRERPPKWI